MKKTLVIILVFFSQVLFAQSGWQWVNPKPYIHNSNDIVSINNNTYILIGNTGSIFRTENKGLNWKSVSDPDYIHYNLNVGTFVNTQIGYICGDSGTFLKTSNSGNQWNKLNTAANENLYGISFLNSSTGFVTGYQCILKTTDGGTTWNNIIDSAIFNGLKITKPYFINSNTGWVIGVYSTMYYYEKLFKTTNSGISWEEQLDARIIINYNFVNSEVGYLALNRGYYLFKSSLSKTTNGGNNWFNLNLPDTNLLVKDIYFKNELTGYVIDTFFNRTTNGGIDWEKETIPFAFSTTKLYDDNKFFYDIWNLNITTNNGMSWNKINYGFNEAVSIMTFFNPSTGIFRKNNTELIKTIDNGLTWFNLDTTLMVPFRRITFKNEMELFAIAYQYDTIHISTDGGFSWNNKKLGDSLVLEDIQCIDNCLFIAAERLFKRNVFCKSADNGATWSFHELDSSAGFSKIKFFDKNNGYFKSARRLFRTIDGGENWNELLYNPEINFRFDNFDFVNVNTGWLSHMSGTAYITTNAGLNWNISDFSQYFLWGISDIKAFNQDTCIIFSTEKYLSTTNMGRSWNLRYNPAWELFSYYFVNNKYFWASGSNGKILNSSNGLGLFSDNIEIYVPRRFYLYQNYPNPFNPVTSFKYELPQTAYTTLKLYDILGREVKSIVDGINTEGIHIIEGSFNDLASGIYFIKLVQGQYVQSRKIVLVK